MRQGAEQAAPTSLFKCDNCITMLIIVNHIRFSYYSSYFNYFCLYIYFHIKSIIISTILRFISGCLITNQCLVNIMSNLVQQQTFQIIPSCAFFCKFNIPIVFFFLRFGSISFIPCQQFMGRSFLFVFRNQICIRPSTCSGGKGAILLLRQPLSNKI